MERQGYSFRVSGVVYVFDKKAQFYGAAHLPVRDDCGKLLGFANIVGTDGRGWPVVEGFLDYNIPERLDFQNGQHYFFEANVDQGFVKNVIMVPWPACNGHDCVIASL